MKIAQIYIIRQSRQLGKIQTIHFMISLHPDFKSPIREELDVHGEPHLVALRMISQSSILLLSPVTA